MQVEQSQQDKVEALQQQREVLLLAFTRFKELLLKAEEPDNEHGASEDVTMNGTSDGPAGKSTLTSLWKLQGLLNTRQHFIWSLYLKHPASSVLSDGCSALLLRCRCSCQSGRNA